MLFSLVENILQGRTKMIDDGIMDRWWREFKSNVTKVEEVAFNNQMNIIVFLVATRNEVGWKTF